MHRRSNYSLSTTPPADYLDKEAASRSKVAQEVYKRSQVRGTASQHGTKEAGPEDDGSIDELRAELTVLAESLRVGTKKVQGWEILDRRNP